MSETVHLDIPYKPQAKQQLLHACPANEVLYGGAAGGGKFQNNVSSVITPYGTRQMGSLKVGDRVCNPSGKNSTIIAVHPQGDQQLYRVEFSDGSSTEAGGPHLWQYSVARKGKWRKSGLEWKIATTGQLIGMMESGRRILIPLTKPVQFTKSYRFDYRKIDPYVLGVLIGDGCFRHSAPSFTSVDDHIIQRVFSVYTNDWRQSKISYHSRGNIGKELRYNLEKLGLWGKVANSKSIPSQYLYWTIENRLELLRGLMDTDGYCTQDGKAYYCTISKQLAEDITWLVRSLGGNATIFTKPGWYKDSCGNRVECQLAYHIYIRMPDNSICFSLPRKKELAKLYNAGRMTLKKRITNITPVGKAESQCITVDHPNGLYITDDFIVTHNSYALLWDLYLLCNEIPNLQAYLFRRTFPELERTHIIKSQKEFPTHIEDERGIKHQIAVYKEGKHRWEFSNGSMLHFCHAERDDDVYRYKSEEMHILAMDELTSFLEGQYRFLRSRVRMDLPMWEKLSPILQKQLPGIKAGSNPGDRGHAWVKRYWIDQLQPSVDYEFHTKKFPVEEGGKTRCYIPAKLEDNEYISTEEYEGGLVGIGGVLATAMREGNWDIFAGQAFPELRREIHGIEPFSWENYTKQFMVMDWGYAKPFSIGWYCVDFDGVVYRIYEWYGRLDPNKADEGLRMNVDDVAQRIKEIEKDMQLYPTKRIAGMDLWIDRGGSRRDSSGPTLAEEFGKCGIRFQKCDNRRLQGKYQVHMRLAHNDGYPMFRVITQNCPYFWKLMPNMVLDEKNIEDVSDKQEDHLYEELRYAFMSRPIRTPKPKKSYPHMSLGHFKDVERKARGSSRRTGKNYESEFVRHFNG